jgi:hypothetical protein
MNRKKKIFFLKKKNKILRRFQTTTKGLILFFSNFKLNCRKLLQNRRYKSVSAVIPVVSQNRRYMTLRRLFFRQQTNRRCEHFAAVQTAAICLFQLPPLACSIVVI